jgi:hypothetical protein
MNAYSRTLPLAGGNGVAVPVRESGSSALDRRSTWTAPDPSTRILDPWGAPAARAVIRTDRSPWAAPDPSLRVALPAPVSGAVVGVSNIVEPFHPIDVPDLVAARQASFAPPAPVPSSRPLPPPTLADAAERLVVAPVSGPADRSGVRRRLAIGLAAVAGVACAAAAAAVTLF